MLDKFNNTSLMAKITAIFGVLVLFTAGIGSVGYSGMKDIKDGGDEIYDNYLVSIINLTDVGANLGRFMLLQKSHIIAPNDTVMNNLETGLAETQATINASLDAFALTLDAGEETEAFDFFTGNLEKFFELNTRIITLSQSNDDIVADELSNGEFTEKFEDIDKLYEIMLKTNVVGAREFAEQNYAVFSSSIEYMAMATGLALILVAVSWFIIRKTVAVPIGAMTAAMRDLAEGDNDIDIPATVRRDEIGDMARAVSVFKENMIERDHLVAERDAERERTEQRLRQITASRTKFFAAASHDLRQPLHAMALRLPMLEDEVNGASSGEAVTAIRNACDTMGALLDTLLDISKLDAGEVTPKIDRVPIADIFEHLATEFAPQAAAKSLALRVAPTSAWGVSDAFLLLRILRNLLVNAVRYTPQGKVLLGVRRRAGRLRLEVWDTGIGIPADQLEHIFEEFYKGETRGSHRDRSLGLGLSIVDRLSRLLGHRVRVRSWPGKGTVFSLELPIAEQQAERDTHDTHDTAPAWKRDLAGLRIVLVEDDAAVLRATESLLDRWGCTVIAADSLAGAVARVAASGRVPDLILADLQLRQGETGVQAIEGIRGASDSSIPAIIITASLDQDRLGEVTAKGYPIVRKPVGPDLLRVAVEAVLYLGAGTAGPDTSRDAALPVIDNRLPTNGSG